MGVPTINLYPDSPYVSEAQEQLETLRSVLAEHELMVATFYSRNRRWRGVKLRLEYLKENYPEFDRMDEVDAMLARADEKLQEWEERRRAWQESASSNGR